MRADNSWYYVNECKSNLWTQILVHNKRTVFGRECGVSTTEQNVSNTASDGHWKEWRRVDGITDGVNSILFYDFSHCCLFSWFLVATKKGERLRHRKSIDGHESQRRHSKPLTEKSDEVSYLSLFRLRARIEFRSLLKVS